MAAPSWTEPGLRSRLADVGIRDGRIAAVGDVDRAGRRDAWTPTGHGRLPRIHRHPHALRRPTALGHHGQPIGASRRDHRAGRQLRILHRSTGPGRRRLHPADDGRRRGHSPRQPCEDGAHGTGRPSPQYLDRVDQGLAVNAGFLVGHSTVRRAVMGDAGQPGAADAEQLAAMVELVEESLAGGALGFSSSLGEGHMDGDGRPVPSRSATFEELVALAGALRDHPGTTFEFIPTVGPIPDDRMELMADMSLAADRPLNWNLLGSLASEEIYEQQLQASDLAASQGRPRGRPDPARHDADAGEHRAARHARMARRPRPRRRRPSGGGVATRHPGPPARRGREGGRTIHRRAGRLRPHGGGRPGFAVGGTVLWARSPRPAAPTSSTCSSTSSWSTSSRCIVVLPSLTPSLGRTDEGWEARVAVWKDPRVMLGGSDAGAHLDLMCHANYPTVVLGEVVRERGLLSMEEAIEMMTDRPARHYGLRHRGRVAEGWQADLVVFDPATVGSEPAATGPRSSRRRRAAASPDQSASRTSWWAAPRW